MRIQFASQFFQASQSMAHSRLLKPIAPTLLLLGNTVNAWTLGGREFLRFTAGSYDAVYIVMGPAEYSANHGECWRVNVRRLVDETAKYKNVEVLCQKSVDAGAGVKVAGATLWGPLNGFNTLSHPDTAWMRERRLVEGVDEDNADHLRLQTIHDDAVRNLCKSDRNYFNEILLSTYKPQGNYVFATYHAPYYECLTRQDTKERDVLGMLNDYRFIFRQPLRLWLCGVGVGGKNYYDRDTGVLFAKNARGDEEVAGEGYSPEMFMDVGTTEIAVVKDHTRMLQLVAENALPDVEAVERDIHEDFKPENQPSH